MLIRLFERAARGLPLAPAADMAHPAAQSAQSAQSAQAAQAAQAAPEAGGPREPKMRFEQSAHREAGAERPRPRRRSDGSAAP
jgi:type IV secretory pathway VirB9-like protein